MMSLSVNSLRSERKTPKQMVKQVYDWITRKQKYQKDLEIFGTRNSYSKTDHDATFMRMKDDYMKNGQLKAWLQCSNCDRRSIRTSLRCFP